MKKLIIGLIALLVSLVTWLPTISYAATPTSSTGKQFIIINKKVNQLAFYQNGKLVKVYPVATGKTRNLTPEGLFKIVNKIKNRPYYKLNIPGGSPRNPLGPRWMGLNALGTNGTTYAIHGTSDESSIGKYISHGCVRMHVKDVLELFDKVQLQTPVLITTSSKSFSDLANENGYYVGPDIIKYETTITVLETVKLYKYPFTSSYIGATLNPQALQTLNKAGDFIQVQTWQGPLWIQTKNYGEGVRTELNTSIHLFENAILRKGPGTQFDSVGVVKPQKLAATEKFGIWYKVNTWVGPLYLTSPTIVEGEIESTTDPVTFTERKYLYTGLYDTKPINSLGPQTVIPFEKIGNFYHIHSWISDVWVK